MSNSKKGRHRSPHRKKLRFDEYDSNSNKHKKLCPLTTVVAVENKIETSTKHKLNVSDAVGSSPKKRSKMNDSNEGVFLRSQNLSIIPGEPSLSTTPKKGKNINKRVNLVRACQNVLTKDFYSIESRLGISMLPNCCTKHTFCLEHHKNDQFNPIMSHEMQAVKISLECGNYHDALTAFRYIITHEKYATADVMMSFTHIIMNIHDGDLPHQIILESFISMFYFMYNTNPPCVGKIKKNYMEFLKMPFNKENRYMCSESNYIEDIGIVDFVINSLQTEIMNTLTDDPLVDSSQFDMNTDDNISLAELQKLKKKHETYCTLQRLDRIKRLTLLLEIIVELLEIDLANWLKRYVNNPRKHIMGQHKPLVAFLLWQNNPFIIGSITDLCRNTLVLFIHTIIYSNSKPIITLLSRFSNILFCIFELSEEKPNYYHATGNRTTVLISEIYKLVKVEKLSVFFNIIYNIKSKSLKYHLCHKLLQDFVNVTEENSFNLILRIFEGKLWNVFHNEIDEIKYDKNNVPMNKDCDFKKYDNEKHRFRSIIKKMQAIKIKSNNDKTEFWQYEKQTCKKVINPVKNINLNGFMKIFYLSFKFSLEYYNIDKILDEYVKNNEVQTKILDEDKQSCVKETKETSLLSINEDCLKYYRSLFQISTEISNIYQTLKTDENVPFDYFQDIKYLQR